MSETATTTLTGAEALPVGTVLYESWGWEQTNVSFYEVVGHTPSGKSVRVRKVAKETVPGSEGFMSGRVVPKPGEFVGAEFTKRVLFSTWRGVTEPYLKMASYSSASKVGDKESFYESSYA